MGDLDKKEAEKLGVDAYWVVNAAGVQEIRDFIRMHHKKGISMSQDEEAVQYYAMLVELNLLAGNGQYFDIEAQDEVTSTNIECWLMEDSISARLIN